MCLASVSAFVFSNVKTTEDKYFGLVFFARFGNIDFRT